MVVWDVDSGIGRENEARLEGRAEAPLLSLRLGALADRFHRWQGRSGRRYVASVFAINHDDPAAPLADFGQAVLIAVRRHGATRREAVGAVSIERMGDWRRFAAAMHDGADEWHVHLLAPDHVARLAVVADLGWDERRLAVA